MELTDLYSDKIIEIAGRLPIIERLAEPDASAKRVSRVCGSLVEVDLKLEGGVVAEYAHDVSACALGQTSSSIVATHILGSTPDELRALRQQIFAMLKEGGVPPTGKWDEFKYLQPVRDYPARHTSTLLIMDAVIDCLDSIEKAAAN